MIRFADNQHIKEYEPKGFSYDETACVRRLHYLAPGYDETPLADFRSMAEELGLKAVLVKDESTRFGLKAFKGLGGIYAMFRMICRELKLDPDTVTPEMLKEPPYCDRIRQMTFATTTDGNHGKGVSWAAGIFGCQAKVFMPAGTVEVRAQAIRDAGNAEVAITDMHYDTCVEWTAKIAEEKGWYLIQDSSWPGFEEVPMWIMQGYTTLYYEALKQMREMGYDFPTHIFLQAGVGAMAGAVAAATLAGSKERKPVITTVESSEAACFYESFAKADGSPHPATGSEQTMMAGLNCSVPCSLAWEILGRNAAGGFSCGDEVTCHGMRLLAHPYGNDTHIVSGESGAVTTGLLDLLMKDTAYSDIRDKLCLNNDSIILLISTEGDTDPDNYKKIICDKKA